MHTGGIISLVMAQIPASVAHATHIDVLQCRLQHANFNSFDHHETTLD